MFAGTRLVTMHALVPATASCALRLHIELQAGRCRSAWQIPCITHGIQAGRPHALSPGLVAADAIGPRCCDQQRQCHHMWEHGGDTSSSARTISKASKASGARVCPGGANSWPHSTSNKRRRHCNSSYSQLGAGRIGATVRPLYSFQNVWIRRR